MHHPTPLRMKALGASLTALLALSACGSNGSSNATDLPAAGPEAISVATTDAVAGPTTSAPPPASSPVRAPETTGSTDESETTSETVAAPAAVEFPAVDVVDLATGQSFSLDTLAPTGPTLVWFWAPH